MYAQILGAATWKIGKITTQDNEGLEIVKLAVYFAISLFKGDNPYHHLAYIYRTVRKLKLMSQEEDIRQCVLKGNGSGLNTYLFQMKEKKRGVWHSLLRHWKQGRCFHTLTLSLNRSQCQFRAKWQQEKMKTNVDSLPPGYRCWWLFWKLLRLVPRSNPNPLLSQATPPIYMTFYNGKLQKKTDRRVLVFTIKKLHLNIWFVISQGVNRYARMDRRMRSSIQELQLYGWSQLFSSRFRIFDCEKLLQNISHKRTSVRSRN